SPVRSAKQRESEGCHRGSPRRRRSARIANFSSEPGRARVVLKLSLSTFGGSKSQSPNLMASKIDVGTPVLLYPSREAKSPALQDVLCRRPLCGACSSTQPKGMQYLARLRRCQAIFSNRLIRSEVGAQNGGNLQ